MKLPKGDQAIVDIAKLRDYCLNPTHVEGKFKARVFLSMLGIGVAESGLLRQWLIEAAASAEVAVGRADEYGQRYVIDFDMTYKTRSGKIRSAWMIRSGEDIPRLVTCYVL